jgi:hypothetical protein
VGLNNILKQSEMRDRINGRKELDDRLFGVKATKRDVLLPPPQRIKHEKMGLTEKPGSSKSRGTSPKPRTGR